MMNDMDLLITSLLKLVKYCESENFKGWDPYDGLNSRIFQALPFLKKIPLCRLIVIQGFKRFPFNLRRLAMVPKEFNPKGIGLLLQGYCNLYKAIVANPELVSHLGTAGQIKDKINELAELLISLQSKGYSGACWGYNFDWQARRLFLFPKYTPTVVATNFCAVALIDAYEVTKNQEYLDVALSAAEFVMQDLHRTKCNEGFLSSTFLEIDRRRPQPPKELASKGPQDYAEYTLALVQNQTRTAPRTSGKSHPFCDTS
jgi:hypothetical protein